MWTLQPNDPGENGSEASSYGGYTGRKEYEKQARPRRIWLRVLGGVGLAAVLVLAGFGVAALLRGRLFTEEVSPENSGVVLRVPAASSSDSVEALVESTREYTVTLTLELSDGSTLKKTGFIVTSDGCVLTDASPFQAHTVRNVTALTVSFGSVSANFVGIDEVTGIAVVRLQSNFEYGPILFANSDYVKSGCEVFSVSAAGEGDFYGCVLAGRIMTVVPKTALYAGETLEYEGPLFYVDFSINTACAGAPLMNSEGKMVGFCTAGIASPYRMSGVAVPSSSLGAILNRVLTRQDQEN